MLLAAVSPSLPPAAWARDSAVVDDQSRAATLNRTGLDPKKLGKGYLVTVKRERWTHFVEFQLSDDKRELILTVNLGNVDEGRVTAERWKNLLVANYTIHPVAFM